MRRNRMIWILGVLLGLLLGAPASARQPHHDSGEFVILSAQYGSERHHVDVTRQLMEEARRDKLFRTSNGVFGVDPDPGVVKTLRIFARGNDGRERVFEFREGSTVDGAMFRGWGHGNWGEGKERWSGRWNGDEGEFVIVSAQYGTQRHHMDVTERLCDLARRDRNFRVTNESMGGDPDYGKGKVLRIYARGANGRERMFEFSERSTVDGSRFRGWERGDWAHGRERWSGRWEGEERDR